MISKVEKISIGNTDWYYQEFTPDNPQDEYAVNLYDSKGDFVREFDSYEEMARWVEQLEPMKFSLSPAERRLIREMCQIAIFNFHHAASEAYCPNEYERNVLQNLLTKVYFAGKKG